MGHGGSSDVKARRAANRKTTSASERSAIQKLTERAHAQDLREKTDWANLEAQEKAQGLTRQIRMKAAMKEEVFSSNSHSMMDTTKSICVNASFGEVPAQRAHCDESQPNTRIQILLIGGKKETLKVNLSTTVLQLYAHIKAVSGFAGQFSLMAGFPPKALNDPNKTVEHEKLQGSRIQQTKV